MEAELEKLVELCKVNDHHAFETLYRKYYQVFLGIALRYASNRQEAEDTLQDAFIRIFHNIHTYNGTGSFEGWLKRIVQNTSINSYRAKLRTTLHVEISEEEDEISDDSFLTIFESFETKDIVKLLNGMPEGYRVVTNLYFIDGYSHSEIARMLHISPGTSKSQLFKAKKYLKGLIEIYNQEKIS